MSKLIYSMGVSLDGCISGPQGEGDWAAPDAELHRFHNQQARELAAHLLGRRLYEVMRYWDTPEASDPGRPEHEIEFARLWRGLPKVVFTNTLESVEGNARIAERDPVEELAVLRGQSDKDLAVGGAGLASTFMKLDLIDEYRMFVSPVVLGCGTRFFAPIDRRIDLELVETRTFGSRVVYMRYAQT
jgi:dihydrofolate reductase